MAIRLCGSGRRCAASAITRALSAERTTLTAKTWKAVPNAFKLLQTIALVVIGSSLDFSGLIAKADAFAFTRPPDSRRAVAVLEERIAPTRRPWISVLLGPSVVNFTTLATN